MTPHPAHRIGRDCDHDTPSGVEFALRVAETCGCCGRADCPVERHVLARVVRQLLRDLAERTWRPIASAPKDGTKVLCWSAVAGYFIARFDGTYWLVGIGAIVYPTHWMPLPDGPGEGRR